VKGTLVSCYVHQYWFLKFLPFSQEEGTCVVSCVHQHHCIIFELCSPVKETVVVLMCSRIIDQNLCFLIERERLLILFHCCRICFRILFEKSFSMLSNLSGCSCAENICNSHAIIAILLIFLHKYLVFVLSPSSFTYIIDWKTSGYIIS
jgi:hypothetical protein